MKTLYSQTSFTITEVAKSRMVWPVSVSIVGEKNLLMRQLFSPRRCKICVRTRQDISKDSLKILRFGVLNNVESSKAVAHEVLGITSKFEKQHKGNSYLFRTEFGGLVQVSVGVNEMKYSVYIEVQPLPQPLISHNMILCWGTFRSDSSQLQGEDSYISVPSTTEFKLQAIQHPIKTPFAKDSSSSYMIALDFNCNDTPFYLSFLLQLDGNGNESRIRTHRKTNFCVPVGLGRGYPMPLGVSLSNGGSVNFSLFSRNAEIVVLCLFEDKTSKPSLEIELDPYINRTGDIWHVSIGDIANYIGYGYRCKGEAFPGRGNIFHAHHVILDPYSKVLRNFSHVQGNLLSKTKYLGCLRKEPNFQWCDDIRPQIPMEKLVVYRLSVGQFTKCKSSGLPKNISGTFTGLIKKLPHLINLGVNALLLEPIFPFDEERGPYFPYHFFSPVGIYGGMDENISVMYSMKEMVKTLHAHGMEILLEVPFTHTCEGGDANSESITFRGIDNSSYYIVDGNVHLETWGALKCNDPVVQKLILDCLHYWVTEFHVDGFCFVNSSSLLQGSNKDVLPRSPLVEAISFDPLLSSTKIMSDCWSPLDMLYKDAIFPHWQRWAEMNSKYFHDIRNFVRGEGLLSDLATRLCGSGDVFTAFRGPAYSFNYITKNAGLTLVDLVSFSHGNLASEMSWNCGEEGLTDKNSVLEIRLRQVRNFLFILFVSLGVPVINMGDEFGYSTGGLPSYTNRLPIDWSCLRTRFSRQTTAFITFLSSFRNRRSDIFQRKSFLNVENITWYGSNLTPPMWEDPSCKFLAMELKAERDSSSQNANLFITFNASNFPEPIALPELSVGYAWFCLVDTSLAYPYFFSSVSDSNSQMNEVLFSYEVKAHSCALFEAKDLNH